MCKRKGKILWKMHVKKCWREETMEEKRINDMPLSATFLLRSYIAIAKANHEVYIVMNISIFNKF